MACIFLCKKGDNARQGYDAKWFKWGNRKGEKQLSASGPSVGIETTAFMENIFCYLEKQNKEEDCLNRSQPEAPEGVPGGSSENEE